MRSLHPWILAAAIFTGMLQGSARAEMFLKLPGEPGSSINPRYSGWSDVYGLEFGYAPALTRGTTTSSLFTTFSVTKAMDATSPGLVMDFLNHRRYDSIQIHATQNVGMKFQVFTITLTGAKIISVEPYYAPPSQTATGPIERVRIFYEGIEWTCIEIADARPVAASTLNWNAVTATGSTTYSLPLDSDNDGMPDEYELAVGLNPNLNDASLDTDGDGINNLLEYHAGTDPRSANSVFRTTMQVRPDGNIQLSWPSLAGKTYKIHSSATLATDSWELLTTIPSAGDGTTTCTIPPASANCFFRVETQ